jgi:hypothetical protein
MIRLRLILFVNIIILVFSSSCKKKIITNTITDTVLVRAVDTTFIMNAKSWNCYSYQSLALIDSGATKYFTTAEGIKFMGQAYRLGTRIQIKSELGFYNKVIYFKWKGYGAGQYAAFVPQIKYDPLTNDGVPPIQGVDLALFSVGNTFGGSTLIQENVWYYTRIVPVPGSDNYQVITATGNYNNMGGTTISSTSIPIYTKSGYIALRMGDCYGSTNAYGVIGECKIAPN